MTEPAAATLQVLADDPARRWDEPGVYSVAPGVHRIPLPLPHDGLHAVNVYAVEDDEGLVLVDGGWAIAEARERLTAGLAALGADLRDVHRFLVTHVHRDHYTLAVTLRAEYGMRVVLGAGEQVSIRTANDPSHPLLADQVAALHAAGAGVVAERIVPGLRRAETPVEQWAPPDTWLDDGDVVAVGGRSLHVVHTPGHTRGHVVFRDADAGLLFAGDHVLPHITPSIGFEQSPPPLPLRDFLGALQRVRDLPDATLLPAHGPTGGSVHARVDALLAHHDERLAHCRDLVGAGPATAYAVARALPWTRRRRVFEDLDPFNQLLAVLETVAHLDLLAHRGVLTRGEGDVVEYAPAPHP